jgi:hypothetical protein
MLHAHSSPLYSPQGAVAGSQNIYSPQPHLGHQVVSDPHTGLGQQTTQMFTSSHQPGSQVRPGLQGAGAYNQTLIGSQPIQSNPSRAPGSLLAQPQQPNATGYGYTNAGGAGLTMQGGAEGDIKVINGRRYREVKEERTEVNERGQAVKKFIVKLEPLDENVKKVDPTGSLSTQGGLSGTSSQYSNYNVGYNQGAPTTFTGFIPR